MKTLISAAMVSLISVSAFAADVDQVSMYDFLSKGGSVSFTRPLTIEGNGEIAKMVIYQGDTVYEASNLLAPIPQGTFRTNDLVCYVTYRTSVDGGYANSIPKARTVIDQGYTLDVVPGDLHNYLSERAFTVSLQGFRTYADNGAKLGGDHAAPIYDISCHQFEAPKAPFTVGDFKRAMGGLVDVSLGYVAPPMSQFVPMNQGTVVFEASTKKRSVRVTYVHYIRSFTVETSKKGFFGGTTTDSFGARTLPQTQELVAELLRKQGASNDEIEAAKQTIASKKADADRVPAPRPIAPAKYRYED